MRAFLRLTWIDLKLYLREPVAVFFTVAFPPLLVLLFGVIYGNEPSALFGGRGSMDVSMPAYTAMVLGVVAFIGIPVTIAANRESGVLRRFRATSLRPVTYIAADVVSNLAMTLVGMGGLVLVGWALYRVRFEGHVGAVLAAVVLSALAMFSLGYLIASLVPTARAAQVVGLAVFYPMTFLSGAALPLELLPEGVRRVSDLLPLTFAVKLLRGLWIGDALRDHLLEIAVLLGVLVVATAVAARAFRWE